MRIALAGLLLLAACHRTTPPTPPPPPPQSPAEAAYQLAFADHVAWRDAELGDTWDEMGDAYNAFRDGVGQVVDSYQTVIQAQEPAWTACALYQQGRVYGDAAARLIALQDTSLYATLQAASPAHVVTIERLLDGYLNSATDHLDYAASALTYAAHTGACHDAVVDAAACTTSLDSASPAERAQCFEGPNPFPEGPRI